MSVILNIKNVSFENVINYPDLYVNEGEATFIVGESGCGKSTLLKLFNATVSPRKGELFYKGQEISKINTIALRKEALLVSQNVFLFDDTIENNFKEYYGFLDRELIPKEKMAGYMSLCCVDFSLDADCTLMSGGERQRIFIAICLSLLPTVLMLDEPTSALDEKTSNDIMINIKKFCNENNITLVVVSHDREITEKYADRIITLEREVGLQ